jgi:hypothetical protein
MRRATALGRFKHTILFDSTCGWRWTSSQCPRRFPRTNPSFETHPRTCVALHRPRRKNGHVNPARRPSSGVTANGGTARLVESCRAWTWPPCADQRRGGHRKVASRGATSENRGGTGRPRCDGRRDVPGDDAISACYEALSSALPTICATEIEPVWLAAASALVPELRQYAVKFPKLAVLEPERQQARLFEGLAQCLEGIARTRPLLAVFEDLHWSAAATVRPCRSPGVTQIKAA